MQNMTKPIEKQGIPSFHLLIAAGGNGTRMHQNTPKQFMRIHNKSILQHTLDKFLPFPSLKSIVIVASHDAQTHLNDTTLNNPQISFTESGKTRKQSIYNGLKKFSNVLDEDIILIHDAARPLICTTDIGQILKIMTTTNAATLATPITESLIKDNQTISREGLLTIQTPQAFHFGTIMRAHENFKNDDTFTDDAGLVRANGENVTPIMATAPNIKITTPADFDMVKAMIEQTTETRTASGFDVHAFETEKTSRPLKLGGIIVNHDYALAGHSDADVILHAITDAILGGINKGDIGTHFPPSDPQWKDKDSQHFLEHAHKLLLEIGGDIRFIDVTIMAEAPKMIPYREKIQTNIAQILNMNPNRVSIKATTTEKLGFVGRKEGIACQALATMTIPNDETK